VSPRQSPATASELARIGLLATLSGETLVELARRMTRAEVDAGSAIDAAERFCVVLNGMASSRGRMLRPGDTFGLDGSSARAVTRVTIASCDRETYDELVRPPAEPGSAQDAGVAE
jgi:hypothetical protein